MPASPTVRPSVCLYTYSYYYKFVHVVRVCVLFAHLWRLCIVYIVKSLIFLHSPVSSRSLVSFGRCRCRQHCCFFFIVVAVCIYRTTYRSMLLNVGHMLLVLFIISPWKHVKTERPTFPINILGVPRVVYLSYVCEWEFCFMFCARRFVFVYLFVIGRFCFHIFDAYSHVHAH